MMCSGLLFYCSEHFVLLLHFIFKLVSNWFWWLPNRSLVHHAIKKSLAKFHCFIDLENEKKSAKHFTDTFDIPFFYIVVSYMVTIITIMQL